MFKASYTDGPTRVLPPAGIHRNWSRKELAHWCLEELKGEAPVIIGIDHGFSFPLSYMKRYRIERWDQFLDDFQRHWPTNQDERSVEALRIGNKRTGKHTEFRMTENWTTSAQSVFKLDGAGTVGKSTHCGIPWLRYIRRNTDPPNRPHFWPFDGFEIPPKRSVVTEMFPSLFRKRYSPRRNYTADDHDAMSVARWLKEMDSRRHLQSYFNPPLTAKEKDIARLEGWILGVY